VTFAEAAIEFEGGDPRRWVSYAWLIACSLIVALAWNAYEYVQRTPEGLENESTNARRIAHLRRPKWQFKLARSLMARRLGPLERELRDLEEGKVFVNAFRPESFEAYLRWAQSRFTNLGEMTSVAKLVVTDFVTCLSSSPTHPVTPKDVVESVERLATFYRATVAFESNCRTILPIESLTALHQHLYGWSDPIREAVQQVFRYLASSAEFVGEFWLR